jgi:hypothetical protein
MAIFDWKICQDLWAHNEKYRLIFQYKKFKLYYVIKWQLIIRLFTNYKKMVNSYKCYMLVKG